MYFALHHSAFRPEFPAAGGLVLAKLKEPDAIRRGRALKRVDRELSKGNFRAALSLVKQLQGKPGGLRGFGAAKQVPRRMSSLDELKFSGINISSLEPLVDPILDSVERSIQFASSDEVSLLGLESLMHDESYDSLCEDHLMCMQVRHPFPSPALQYWQKTNEKHEAGHFLVGYLLGVLPKRYRVPSIDALRQDKLAGGRVEFLGFEFLREVDTEKISQKKFSKGNLYDRANKGKISSKTLNRFLCVILGGLAAEHLVFGYSEGLHSDVEKLDRVLKWLGFTESEADSQVRWATLNTVLILGRHREARSRLAEAMALGRSVGFCIDTIEKSLNDVEI
ncbi:hypothetical protein F0562_019860 [Nyssa sinensis]|uniref:Peptidase M41 domain-containing protein n=1 Tax=Nyssa sinensis TaxID=561372 RepID=A0A5J5BUT9_9ASTE|nr:hypothetical protein F0562_019860 [Nyssa sinensis]